MRGAADPDEIVGQVFMELARGVERFDDDWEAFRTLAFVIARRRTVDEIRYHTRRPSDPMASSAFDTTIVGGDVEQEAMTNLDRAWLLNLLELLTPIQRDILTMRLVSGLTVREIAAITGATETGVKANQRRAIESLRRHLTAPDTVDESVLRELIVELGGRS